MPPLLIVLALAACMPPFSAGPANQIQADIEDYARSFLGTPYLWGGESRSGMDCSGLVLRVYSDVARISLPHKSSRIYGLGIPISSRNLQIGDLVFFTYSRSAVTDHVGIYLGHGEFIHASNSSGVIISSLYKPYYRERYIGARRIIKPD